MLEPLRGILDRLPGSLGASDELETFEKQADVDESTHRQPIEAANLLEAFEAPDEATRERALGHLVGIPHLPRSVAKPLIPILLEQAEGSGTSPHRQQLPGPDAATPGARRTSYRALEEVIAHHPDLVLPHIERISRGLAAYRRYVREACAKTMRRLFRRSPYRTPVAYRFLDHDRPEVRTTALELVIEIGDTHPVVLAPLSTYLLEQVEKDSTDRALLATALERLGRWDPSALRATGTILLTWLPAADRGIETATVHALLSFDPMDGELAAELAVSLLEYLPRAQDHERERIVDRMLELLDRHPDIAPAIREWAREQSSPTRQRIRAWFDEAQLRAPAGRSVALFDGEK